MPRLIPILLLGLLMPRLPLHAADSFRLTAKQLHGRTYVRADDVAAYYGMKLWRSKGKQVVLAGSSQRLELTLERREAKINRLVVHLAFAPVLDGDRVMIAERDFTLLIDPILRDWGLPATRVRRIALDAGHGGKDEGARGSRLKEKELTLGVALKVKSILEKYQYEVVLTRGNDTFLELPDRPKLAAKAKADLFISIHFNATETKSVDGIETYVVTPQQTPSTASTEVERTKVTGNNHDRQNARLAYEIHRYLIGATKATDRGIKQMRWAVLRDAQSPAVLIELGFLTNAAEESKIAGDAYRQKLAEAIAAGIFAYDRVMYDNGRR